MALYKALEISINVTCTSGGAFVKPNSHTKERKENCLRVLCNLTESEADVIGKGEQENEGLKA